MMIVIPIVLAFFAVLVFLTAFVCYRTAFYVSRKMTLDPTCLLPGEQYEVFREQSLALIHSAVMIPYEEVSIRSRDGLCLYGRYYETAKGAPLQIMFHGYQSMALRDFCGGLPFALENGFNVLLVDQRAHGRSDGHYLTFGIREKEDCADWVNYAVQRFGTNQKILLVGVSMGASTVLMASGLEMPLGVKGIIADSGYSSPAEIIRKVIGDRHFPVGITYFFLKLGANIFGRLDLDDGVPDALCRTAIPVLLIHGEEDRFVPCEMSKVLYDSCASDKTLITIPGAGHGLGYMVDEPGYKGAVLAFEKKVLADSFSCQ